MDNSTEQPVKSESRILRFFHRPRQDRLGAVHLLFFALLVISLILFLFFSLFPQFADAYNATAGQFFRMILNFLTIWIPFSVSEAVIWSIPLFLVFCTIRVMHHSFDTWRQSFIYTGKILSFLALILSGLILLFSPGFKGTLLSKKTDFDIADISSEELIQTATYLQSELNSLADSGKILYDESDFSHYEGNWQDLNRELQKAYAAASEKYDFIHTFPSTLKPIASSPVLTYTHIAGAYTFFSGEVNINYMFPDYVRIYSSAHEMAHQRGFAREDEANFIAFLVCMESDHPYLRYSALLNCYEYVLSALSGSGDEILNAQWVTLSQSVKLEMVAYNDFFEKYDRNPAATAVNAVSQVVQSAAGAADHSYGMVVDLMVGYYRDINSK